MIYKVATALAVSAQLSSAALYTNRFAFEPTVDTFVAGDGLRSRGASSPFAASVGPAEAPEDILLGKFPHTTETLSFADFINGGVPLGPVSILETPLFPVVNDYLFGVDIALGNDPVTREMAFVSGLKPAYNAGHVIFYKGLFSAWSMQQVLTPPSEFAEQNFFGSVIDLDTYHMRQLAVGCSGCNVSSAEGGAVFLYEPTSPSAKKWTQTGVMTASDDITGLGASEVTIFKDVLIADGMRSSSKVAAVFKGKKHAQTLQVESAYSDLDLYDETIVIGHSQSTGRNSDAFDTLGKVSVFYPSTDKFHLKPDGKPRPVQWSVQQVLVNPPAGAATTEEFGATVSIDGNRMAITSGAEKLAYIYERKEVYGKWSLQSSFTTNTLINTTAILNGNTVTLVDDYSYEIWDETQNWDCLLVSVEDHFGDGWGGAELTVDVPGGDKDFFSSSCDVPNPFQFRYCPAEQSDKGLYRFSIPEAKKAKFHWEQLWRVYEESTGTWFTGNFDTKMDFEWDADKLQFNHKKIEHELPNNITCKECRQKPTPKSKLRKLHSKDHTQSPTLSPAPTMSTTNYDYPWQELKLTTADGADWFDAQHKGTSYYVVSKDGRRLLSVGTMCPWETSPDTKTCWEDYPDGEYILRVGGALDRDQTHTFKFCHADHPITSLTQIAFRVQNGECAIVSDIKSDFLCLEKGLSRVQMVANVEISLLGVTGSLGATEYSEIAAAIASVLPDTQASDVKVLSSTSNGAGVTVSLQVSVNAQTAGIDYTELDTLDAYEITVQNAISSSQHKIISALASADTMSNVHFVTHVDFHHAEVVGNSVTAVTMDGPDMVTDLADASVEDVATDSSSDSHANAIVSVVSVSGYVFAAMGVMLVGFFVASRTNTQATAVPTEEIEVVRAHKRTALSGNALTLDNLKELVHQEEVALETMLKNNA